jgi:ribose transport system substrate-binding protein
MKFIKKFMVFAIVIACIVPGLVFAQGGAEENATAKAEKPYDIAVIIKATDSDFWQYLLVGAQNYGVDFPDDVSITTYGPPSEADIDKQVTILENVISTNPDAIVISSISSDATVPALEDAHEKGIKIITCDNKVNTDVVDSLLATNNLEAGALAADNMLAFMKEYNIPTKGKKVCVVSAMAGVQVLTDRDIGFTNRMKEIAPEVEFVETKYVDNDISKAMSTTEDLITTYGDDLIGIFADNNHSADGVSRSIGEQGLGDQIIVCGFDSDPEEVNAIKSGSLKAICVQDPYNMGYKGVEFAVRAIEGEDLPDYVDTGVVVVTAENINDADVQGKLDPFTLKKY